MRKISPRLLFIVVLLVVFLTHSTYLPNGFTWLDHGDIEQHRAVVPLNQLREIFAQPFGKTGFYRPLVTLFNSTDYALYKSFAPGYHLTNVQLHVLVVAMAPLFLSLFFRLLVFEILLVMLFVGLHPVGWLPVGAISYRPELLAALFVMLTVYLHAKAREKKSPFFAMVTLMSFFCALLSKETALFLVPALIIFWEFLKKDHSQTPWLLLYIPEAIIVCLYLFLHLAVVPKFWTVQYFQAGVSEAIGTRIVILEKLLLHLVSPLKPSLSDAVQITGLFSLPIILALGGFGLLVALLLRIKHSTNAHAHGKQESRIKVFRVLILLGILLLPAMNIVPVPRVGSVHYAYIPLIGFAALLVLTVRFFRSQNKLFRNMAGGFLLLWMTVAIVTVVTNGSRFNNDETLFAPEVAADPAFLEGHFYLGNYYALQKNYPKAEAAYMKSLQVQPGIVAYHEKESTLINLAILKLEKGDIKAAVTLFKSIMPLDDAEQNKRMERFIKSLDKLPDIHHSY